MNRSLSVSLFYFELCLMIKQQDVNLSGRGLVKCERLSALGRRRLLSRFAKVCQLSVIANAAFLTHKAAEIRKIRGPSARRGASASAPSGIPLLFIIQSLVSSKTSARDGSSSLPRLPHLKGIGISNPVMISA